MPPDLQVTWTDLLSALLALERTTDEAATLPRTNYDAFDKLDMRGSRTCSATAEFLTRWGEGLDALAQAGEGLQRWLATAAERLREVDERLAAGH